MARDLTAICAVSPIVPDNQVPAEKVETDTAYRHRVSRAKRSLKGPIPLSAVRENIQASADRLLLVLVAYSDI